MDSIDITDSTFSLGIPDLNQVITSVGTYDYTTFMYIGFGILVISIGYLIYRYYKTKNSTEINDNTNDCPGGFCPMNQKEV